MRSTSELLMTNAWPIWSIGWTSPFVCPRRDETGGESFGVDAGGPAENRLITANTVQPGGLGRFVCVERYEP